MHPVVLTKLRHRHSFRQKLNSLSYGQVESQVRDHFSWSDSGLSLTSSCAHEWISSVHTLKLTKVLGPNVWVIGTSAASRP